MTQRNQRTSWWCINAQTVVIMLNLSTLITYSTNYLTLFDNGRDYLKIPTKTLNLLFMLFLPKLMLSASESVSQILALYGITNHDSRFLIPSLIFKLASFMVSLLLILLKVLFIKVFFR